MYSISASSFQSQIIQMEFLKFNLAFLKFNLALLKFNFTPLKFNFTPLKFNLAFITHSYDNKSVSSVISVVNFWRIPAVV